MSVDIHLTLPDLVARTACPACASGDFSLIGARTVFPLKESFPGGAVAFAKDVADSRRLLSCDACGLWYYSAVPSVEAIRRILDQPGLSTRWHGTPRAAFARARAALTLRGRTGGAILDIGSHTGGFLDSLSSAWTKFALEPMATASTELSGVTILRGVIEDTDLPTESFDCITAFDVFEHLVSPDDAMARLVRSLRPGGFLMIETGTTDCFAARRLGAGWYYLNHVEHYQAFSRRSLLHLLERHGIRIQQVDRVAHEDTRLGGRGRRLLGLMLFTILTCAGREPRLWQWTMSRIRPSGFATPPSTIDLERDHLFVVGQKPAGKDTAK